MSWKLRLATDSILLRVVNGLRGLVTQSFDELQKKQGRQWEASRLVTIDSSAPANNQYTVLKTGSMPVDLKSRVFGYRGQGVAATVYEGPEYTGGSTTGNVFYNLNAGMSGVAPESTLLTGITLISKGQQVAATVFGIGPPSNQGEGATPREYGSNRILQPNTDYLLEIASLDPTSQEVTARIEIFEGDLDWPNNDYQ